MTSSSLIAKFLNVPRVSKVRKSDFSLKPREAAPHFNSVNCNSLEKGCFLANTKEIRISRREGKKRSLY